MPVVATYYIENHKIEVVKTWLGKEKVLLNGSKVSEKSATDTQAHSFQIGNNRFKINKREREDAEKMNAYEILKNEAPIALINIEKQSATKMFILIIAVGLGCGFIIGVLVFNMLLS